MAKTDLIIDAYLGISSKSREEAVLRLLIELGAQFVHAEEGSLLVLDEKKNQLVFARTIGNRSSEKVLIGQRVPFGKGITGLAAQTREVQIGAPTFKTRQARQSQAAGNQPQAVLAAPMLIDDQLIGVLTAVSFQPGKRFSSQDALLYGRIAAVAGVVVDQARRLGTAKVLQRKQRPTRTLSRSEQLDQEIIQSVTALTHAKPHTKERIVALLSAISSLSED